VAAQPDHGGEPAVVDLAEFIDAQPLGGFQIRVALLCASVLFFESFDSNALGYIVPTLTRMAPLPGYLRPHIRERLFRAVDRSGDRRTGGRQDRA
jgi:hypothetical protein